MPLAFGLKTLIALDARAVEVPPRRGCPAAGPCGADLARRQMRARPTIRPKRPVASEHVDRRGRSLKFTPGRSMRGECCAASATARLAGGARLFGAGLLHRTDHVVNPFIVAGREADSLHLEHPIGAHNPITRNAQFRDQFGHVPARR